MMNNNKILLLIFASLQILLLINLTEQQTVTYYQTSFNTTDRLTQKPFLSFAPFTTTPQNRISIDRTQLFQKIHGFGGAFTDAASITFSTLNEDLQQQILELYWGESGIGYTTGRVHMNSCDFSLYTYNFDDVVNDTNLIFFDSNVTHDTITMIPFIQQANETFIATQNKLIEKRKEKFGEKFPNFEQISSNLKEITAKSKESFPAEGLKVFLSPWSPPGWMKVPVNGKQSMDGSATPEGLLEEFHYTWSLYFIKFIEAYLNHGITLWGLTIQNEPEYAAGYEACVYSDVNERNLIISDLGPMIRKTFPYIKILAYDHNRDDVYTWAQTMYSDQLSLEYVDGIAFHWYITQQFQNVNFTYYLQPEKLLFGSEACNCPMSATYNKTNDWIGWKRGESYGQDIIGDLNNFASGWTDWNLVLNTKGGPNHVENYCDAPIVADDEKQEIFIQITYYYMGHISKFILPNYQRVYSDADVIFEASTVAPSGVDQPDVVYLFDGMNIVLWDCQNSPQQQFVYSNNVLYINSTEQCLNIQNESTDDGANVQLYQYFPNSANEMWNFQKSNENSGFDQIISQLNGKCLDLSNSSTVNGANIQMMTCNGGESQQWVFNSQDGSIRSSIDQSKCITAGWSPLLNVAFLSDDGLEVVVVVMNPTNQPLIFDIFDPLVSNTSSIQTSIPAHSIQTYIYPTSS